CQYTKPNRISDAAPKRPRNSSASRKLVVRRISLRPTEDIARPSDGVDHLRQPAFFELATQPADMDVDHIRLRVVMITPNLLEQHGPRDDPAGVPHQIFKQAVFAGQEFDRPAGAAYLASQQIDLQIADAQICFPRRGGTAPR